MDGYVCIYINKYIYEGSRHEKRFIRVVEYWGIMK